MIRRVQVPAPLPLSGAAGVLVTRVTSHKRLVDTLRNTLRAINDAGKWTALHSYGGGLVFRLKRTVNQLPLHAWASRGTSIRNTTSRARLAAWIRRSCGSSPITVFFGVSTSRA